MTRHKNIFILFISVLLFVGCKKQDDFLNVKRNLNDVKPTTLKDMQAILDAADQINYAFPTIATAGSDNSYVSDSYIGIFDPVAVGAYLWKSGNFYEGTGTSYSSDWDVPYSIVERTNIVLDELKNISVTNANQVQYNNVKGAALFYRSFLFYTLGQVFCKPYDKATASSDLGVVIRTTSDVNVKSSRPTVQQMYDQIIADLKEAIALLPTVPDFAMRPSKPTADALLAKVYLAMEDYTNAGHYADSSLQQFNTLLDYNSTLITTQDNPFPVYPNNPEVSFFACGGWEGALFSFPGLYITNVDTTLYRSYDDNDLRKSLFYSNQGQSNIFLRGYYGVDKSQSYTFSGIATNEVYLIRAECYARAGDIPDALADLNTLLQKRYKTGTFSPVSISDPTALLQKILLERRKELAFCGQSRWEDLRRLNKDPRFAITLTRVSNGITYTLPPNDPKYVFPIPDAEIQLSGIQQNPR